MNDDAPHADEIPTADPLAQSTRRALRLLARSLPTAHFSWLAVQSHARRVQRLHITTLVTTCVVLVAGATAAVAAGSHAPSRVHTRKVHPTASAAIVASTLPSTTTTAITTTTTAAPESSPALPPTTTTAPAPARESDLQATLMFAAVPLVAEQANAYTLTVRNISDHAVVLWPEWRLGVFVNGPESGGYPVHESDVVLGAGEERAFASEITPTAEMVGTALVSSVVLQANRAPVDGLPIPYVIGPTPWTQVKIVPPKYAEGQPLDPPFGRWAVVMAADPQLVHVGETVTLHATLQNIGDQVQLTSGYGALAVVCFGQGHGPLVAEWGAPIDAATIAPTDQQTFTVVFRPDPTFASVRDEKTSCMVSVTFHDDLTRIRPLQNLNPPNEVDSTVVNIRVVPAPTSASTSTTTT